MSAGSGMSRRLVVVWVLLAALAVAILLIERHDRAASRAADAERRDERLLLPAAVEELGAIEIVNQGTLHRFERDAAGTWFYHGIHTESETEHGHNADPAAAALIEKAFTGFGRARMERQFPLNVQSDEFGVTRPDILIMVYRPKEVQPLSRYAVGIVAPDGVSRYVLPIGNSQVVTVANFHVGNLLALIATLTGKPAPGQAANAKPR